MKYIKWFLIVIILFVVWSIGSSYLSPLFLPSPKRVLKSFIDLLYSGMLLDSLYMSFYRITIATMIACCISVPLGLLMSTSKPINNIISPLVNVMRFIPVTVFYPLLIMWLGIDEQMKIAFLFFAMFFYFLPSVILAVKETPIDLVDTGYTIGMNNLQVMLRVLLPYSLPSILQNFVLMYGIGWTYIIIVEVTNARYGLGHIMNLATARGKTDLVFVALVVIIIVNVIFDIISKLLIKKGFRWKFAREARK
jgi:NitT/TauT family transport system permease protein